jgi:nitrite reductase (NO-forming)
MPSTSPSAPAPARASDVSTPLIFVAAFVFLCLTIAVGVTGARGDDSPTPTATAAAATTAQVTLTEFKIEPATVVVAKGGVLHVQNDGTVVHNLAVTTPSLKTPDIAPGASAELDVSSLSPGTYEIVCLIPGHAAAGMQATLQISDGSPPNAAAPSAAMAGMPADGSSSSSGDARLDPNAKPGPDWHAFDPTLAPAPGGTVHDVTFHATEKELEVAPGVRQLMWTFNDQVPGPVLRGHVGDVFNVTLVNDGTMGHSIDFHASKVAPNVQMRTIAPDESLVYQFRADYAGIWMYHCGTAPALAHIGNGMYGAVVIDPPGLPAVDHEYLVVQSDLYFGPQGQSGDFTKMQKAEPDAVVFNGYANQYQLSPLKVAVGDRVRVWVLDAGPNESSSFHIVGTIFDTVFKEGQYLLRPDDTHGGSQALDLQPAQGGFVELTLDAAGQYPMVTHKFADVGKGALGLLQAGEVTGTMSH